MLRVILAIYFSLAVICYESLHAEDYDPQRFETTVLATALKQPMQMEIAADGTVFYIEIEGKLKAVSPKTIEPILVGELKITTAQENGLIGMALDPQFAKNGWIYLQYSPPDFPGQHISRFTIVNGKLDLASEKLLLKFEEQRKECCHHAGSMQFGKNGDLFIATGDNTHPHGDSQGYAPIDERPERAPWDAQKSSANTHNYSGKILRIRPKDDGTYDIPEGNLFPRDGSGGRPEIYVMGCRNPWRMAVDRKTGFIYWGDVGPDAGGDGPRGPRGYDEINQARSAGNFGWPYFIANNQVYHDVDFTDGKIGERFDPAAPVNESPNNTGAKKLPPAQGAWIYYPSGTSKEFPELASGGRTACAGPTYHYDPELASPTKFPIEFDRSVFVYEWSRHWIKAVEVDNDFNVKKIEPFLPKQTFVRPIDLEFGPEGSLYVIEYGDTWGVNQNSRLIRIDYMRGNRAPSAVVSAENNIGKHPLEVSLSSKGSFDKDSGDELAYEWRIFSSTAPKDDVPSVVSREPHPKLTFDQPGVFNVELTVIDRAGAKRTASIPVLAGNARPTVKILEPRSGDFYDPTQPIKYRLSVSDAEDGTSDFERAEAENLNEIDTQAPMRITLNAVFAPGALPKGNAADELGPAGMKMMKKSDCFNCHSVDQKRVGPPLIEIAEKYRNKAGALEASIERVLKGSTGVWGKIPMIPHAQHTPEEVREMVGWVYSLQPAGLVRVFHGFVGEIPVKKEEGEKPGYYRLEANYLDRGAGVVPAITASAEVFLRQRRVEAETADEIHGSLILNGGSAGGKKFVGGIAHGQYIRFREILLHDLRKLKFHLASAGAGGAIEVRLDRTDGELLGTCEVKVNGEWEKWYEAMIEVAPRNERRDLVFVFVHPEKKSGLMNLDAIEFLP